MSEELTPQGRKKRPGRNKKEDKQSKKVLSSFTVTEHGDLLKKAKKNNIKQLAVYVRLKALERDKEIEKYATIDLELKADLRKIGVNINQIAKKLNSKFGSVNLQELNEKIEVLGQKLEEILKNLR